MPEPHELPEPSRPLATPRSFTFLVNPSSGGGAAPGAVLPVSRLLRDAGARVDVTYSPGPTAMIGLVEEAVSRGDVVVSVGGDGMLSSLAGAVSLAGGTLAVVPAGRGNDFARMLTIPSAAAEQADLLLHGAIRTVDLISCSIGAAGPRRVAGSVYCGVDARAAELVDSAHRLPRKLQYPYAALRAFAGYRPATCRVSVDGVTATYAAANVVVANSGYYGNGMLIAPAAELDDGLLDVIVIEASSKLSLMRSLPKVYDGAHVDLPQVSVLRGRRIELAADGAASSRARRVAGGRGAADVPVGGDGEPLSVLPGLAEPPAVIEVLPGALSIIAPDRSTRR